MLKAKQMKLIILLLPILLLSKELPIVSSFRCIDGLMYHIVSQYNKVIQLVPIYETTEPYEQKVDRRNGTYSFTVIQPTIIHKKCNDTELKETEPKEHLTDAQKDLLKENR